MKKLIFFFSIIYTVFACSGCGSQTTNVENANNGESRITVTTYTANDFRSKSEAAKKWAENNSKTEPSESYQRYESDIITVGESTYLASCWHETDGMVEIYSCLLEKYENGKKTVLNDSRVSYEDCPFLFIKDGDIVILFFKNPDLSLMSTWGDGGKLVIAFYNGDVEIIEYYFTAEEVADGNINAASEGQLRSEFIHILKGNEIASVMFVSAPEEMKYGGVTTRLFELDGSLTPVSSMVINGDGIFEENYTLNQIDQGNYHLFPELFE